MIARYHTMAGALALAKRVQRHWPAFEFAPIQRNEVTFFVVVYPRHGKKTAVGMLSKYRLGPYTRTLAMEPYE